MRFLMQRLYRRLLKETRGLVIEPVAKKLRSNIRDAFRLSPLEPSRHQQLRNAEATLRLLQWLRRLSKAGRKRRTYRIVKHA